MLGRDELRDLGIKLGLNALYKLFLLDFGCLWRLQEVGLLGEEGVTRLNRGRLLDGLKFGFRLLVFFDHLDVVETLLFGKVGQTWFVNQAY